MSVIIKFVIVLGISFILLFLPPSIHAGVITLHSGEKITGTILLKTDEYLEVEINGQVETIKREHIASIAGKKPAFEADKSKQSTLLTALESASKGTYLHAEEMFKDLLKKDPDSNISLKALEIISDFRKGLIDYDYTLALFQGAYYFYSQDFHKAIAVYEQALEVNPQAIEIYYNLANAYLVTGESQKAAEYLEKLIKVSPNDLEIMFSLAVAYQSLGRHSEAVGYFKEVISVSPYDPEVHSLLASSYYVIGKAELGKKAFHKAKLMFEESGQLDRAEKIDILLGNLP
jgi:tetratricopeptide (TPR) repeat protein